MRPTDIAKAPKRRTSFGEVRISRSFLETAISNWEKQGTVAQPFIEPCAVGVITAQPSLRPPGRVPISWRRPTVLAACIVASSMVFIDGSALTVALPNLRAYFGADLTSVQWVLNSYVLALASLTLVGGVLGDVYGKKSVLSVTCLAFGIASAACAFAPSVAWLVFIRVVQGIAAAVLAPTSLALIGSIYPDNQRNRAIAVWASASALTTAAGPAVGGWLTEQFGWQAVFAINPPLAFVAFGLVARFAPLDRRQPHRFDFVGAAILASGLGVLAWALGQIDPGNCAAARSCWAHAVGVAAALGSAVLAAVGYGYWECITGDPMTPPRLVENKVFVSLNIATLLIYAGLAIMFFLLPFDLVDRRGLSPTEAGFAFLPFTLGMGLLSRAFGAAADSIGARTMLIAGPLGATVAYVGLGLGKTTSLWLGVIGPMALLGISFAALVAPLTATVMSSLDQTDAGLASGVNNAVSRVAQLAGIALSAGIASYSFGYEIGMAVAALITAMAASVIVTKLPRAT
jgi:EmrB/QacA subfamily drug resistance transporter